MNAAAIYLTTQGSVNHLVPSQPLQTSAVGSPVLSTVSGHASITVEVYALGVGITIAREGNDLRSAQGTFELEANGVRFVIDPSHCRKAHWLVAPVQGDVAAIGQLLQAVDQQDLAQLGSGFGHGGQSSVKTAILSLPQGCGKSAIAQRMAHFIGCTWVVEEWHPGQSMFPGALHLTNADVQGGAA